MFAYKFIKTTYPTIVWFPEPYRGRTLPRHFRHMALSLNGSFNKLFHDMDHRSFYITNDQCIYYYHHTSCSLLNSMAQSHWYLTSYAKRYLTCLIVSHLST